MACTKKTTRDKVHGPPIASIAIASMAKVASKGKENQRTFSKGGYTMSKLISKLFDRLERLRRLLLFVF